MAVSLFSHSAVSISFATPWTVARQAPLSMGFSRQEHWSGWSFLFPGDLPDPGIEPRSPSLQAVSLPMSHQESPVFVNLDGINGTPSWSVHGDHLSYSDNFMSIP